jgi:Tfp pilus assembly protein FimT
MRSQRGVTLVEMVVIIAILVVVAAISVPFLGSALRDARTRGAAEQVQEALRTARQYAIATTAVYRVILQPTNVQVTCTDGTPAGNVCAPNRPPDINEPLVNAAEGATLSASPSEIRFNNMGATTTGAATVDVTNAGGEQWQVVVNVAGRVRACSPSCS